jgi:rubrerythrin
VICQKQVKDLKAHKARLHAEPPADQRPQPDNEDKPINVVHHQKEKLSIAPPLHKEDNRDFHCVDCGAPFKGKPDKCTACGATFDWEAIG